MGEIEVKVPRFDPAMEEATITEWLKSEGDSVEKDEPIAAAEGEKTTSEVKAPQEGVIKSLSVEEGDEVEVGSSIAVIETKD